jgi:hypothetical protein
MDPVKKSRRGKRGGEKEKAKEQAAKLSAAGVDAAAPAVPFIPSVVTYYCEPREECNLFIKTLVGNLSKPDTVKQVVFECLRSDLKRANTSFISTMLVDAEKAKCLADTITILPENTCNLVGSLDAEEKKVSDASSSSDAERLARGMVEVYVVDGCFHSERELLDFFDALVSYKLVFNSRKLPKISNHPSAKDLANFHVRMAFLFDRFGCHRMLMELLDASQAEFSTHLPALEQLQIGMRYHHDALIEAASKRLMDVKDIAKTLSPGEALAMIPHWQQEWHKNKNKKQDKSYEKQRHRRY